MKQSGAQQRAEKPWLRAYEWARRRCRDVDNKSYASYGERGIEFKMKPRDFKYLWYRDAAYEMKRPSIDRIDSQGHYEIDNCRYLELSDNVSRKYNVCHCEELTVKEYA